MLFNVTVIIEAFCRRGSTEWFEPSHINNYFPKAKEYLNQICSKDTGTDSTHIFDIF